MIYQILMRNDIDEKSLATFRSYKKAVNYIMDLTADHILEIEPSLNGLIYRVIPHENEAGYSYLLRVI